MPNTLYHPPAEVIRQLLVERGVGSMPSNDGTRHSAWPVFWGNEPSSPDDCITIKTTAGIDYGRSMPDSDIMGPAGFQVRVRSAVERVGWRKADEIQTMFSNDVKNDIIAVQSDGEDYVGYYSLQNITGIGDVIPIGKEPDGNRRIHTINALAPLVQLPDDVGLLWPNGEPVEWPDGTAVIWPLE